MSPRIDALERRVPKGLIQLFRAMRRGPGGHCLDTTAIAPFVADLSTVGDPEALYERLLDAVRFAAFLLGATPDRDAAEELVAALEPQIQRLVRLLRDHGDHRLAERAEVLDVMVRSMSAPTGGPTRLEAGVAPKDTSGVGLRRRR